MKTPPREGLATALGEEDRSDDQAALISRKKVSTLDFNAADWRASSSAAERTCEAPAPVCDAPSVTPTMFCDTDCVPSAAWLTLRAMSCVAAPCSVTAAAMAAAVPLIVLMTLAIERMSERCQHPDVDLFAATVRLQEKTGGNLTGLLKLNAHTVRDRHKMRLKIKAASSEGRASAMILTSAPFIAVGFIMISSPHFYGDVIDQPMVKYGLAAVGFWIFLGNMIMRRMIDMRL